MSGRADEREAVPPETAAGAEPAPAPGRAPLAVAPGPLRVDDAELAACVSCGLCLPHCPTWRVTGAELLSPRGRIAAMRAVQWGGAELDGTFVRAMDTCVQCRGCEPACPSGVPFGRLMEGTREALAFGAGRGRGAYQPWWRRLGYEVLGRHRLLLAGSTALAVAQRLRLVPERVDRSLPRLSLRRPRLRRSNVTGEPVWLFTGCVMDAWQRDVHVATIAVLEAAGARVRLPGDPGCCGALHAHAGLRAGAERLARRVIAALPGDDPVLVSSAGCGAALKDYGHLLGTPEAERFARRVLDVHEWLAARADRLPPPVRPLAGPVAVQDPCHLRHVQRAHPSVRAVLAPYATLVELDDEGLCCGAGGTYSALQPDLAAGIRARKLEAIGRTGAAVVASANPGCALHLAAAGVDARHPMTLVAEAAGLPG